MRDAALGAQADDDGIFPREILIDQLVARIVLVNFARDVAGDFGGLVPIEPALAFVAICVGHEFVEPAGVGINAVAREYHRGGGDGAAFRAERGGRVAELVVAPAVVGLAEKRHVQLQARTLK